MLNYYYSILLYVVAGKGKVTRSVLLAVLYEFRLYAHYCDQKTLRHKRRNLTLF